jgi:hypothetical protein
VKKEINTESENRRRKRKEENNKNTGRKQIHSLCTMSSNKSNNLLKNK